MTLLERSKNIYVVWKQFSVVYKLARITAYAVALVEVVAASRKQYCFAILELHGGGGQVLHIACLKNSRAEPWAFNALLWGYSAERNWPHCFNDFLYPDSNKAAKLFQYSYFAFFGELESEVSCCRDAKVQVVCRVLPQQVEVPVLTKRCRNRNHAGAISLVNYTIYWLTFPLRASLSRCSHRNGERQTA